MKVKLDENLSRHLKPAIEHVGHDVATTAEERLLGRSDIEVARAAKTEGRILLTLDIEFADLRKHPPGSHPGIVLFGPRTMGSLAVNALVEAFLRAIDLASLTGCVAVVDHDRVRVRRPAEESHP